MPKELARLLENAEYYVMVDGVKVGEIKFEDIEGLEEAEDDKIHITQLEDRIVISRDGIILDELCYEEQADDHDYEMDSVASMLSVSDMISREMLKTKPDPIIIDEDSEFLLIEEQEPSIICVREKTDRSSFMSSLGTGGTTRYYADDYEIDKDRYLNVLSNGELVAVHLMENVERVWLENAVVKNESEEVEEHD